MNEAQGRALLYGGAMVLVGGLCAASLLYRPEPDVYTLLSSADVQLRLAYAIPAVDKQGVALSSRDEMIADAQKHLEMVEKIKPGMACTAEFRGFVHMLRGEPKQAAAVYAEARNCQDCTAEQGDVLAFNEARMLAEAGEVDAALRVFSVHAARLDSRFGTQRQLEEASILRRAGRLQEAEARVDVVVAGAAVDAMSWLQAGREYLELGEHDKAERALTAAQADVPIANYYLARLKLAAGDVDRTLALLETATAAVPGDARRLLREEADVWQGIATDVRFEQLQTPRAATPGR